MLQMCWPEGIFKYHCVTLQLPHWDFVSLFVCFGLFVLLLNFILFTIFGRGLEIARAEGGFKGTGSWMGSGCMMWHPQRIDKKLKKNMVVARVFWGHTFYIKGERKGVNPSTKSE